MTKEVYTNNPVQDEVRGCASRKTFVSIMQLELAMFKHSEQAIQDMRDHLRSRMSSGETVEIGGLDIDPRAFDAKTTALVIVRVEPITEGKPTIIGGHVRQVGALMQAGKMDEFPLLARETIADYIEITMAEAKKQSGVVKAIASVCVFFGLAREPS